MGLKWRCDLCFKEVPYMGIHSKSACKFQQDLNKKMRQAQGAPEPCQACGHVVGHGSDCPYGAINDPK